MLVQGNLGIKERFSGLPSCSGPFQSPSIAVPLPASLLSPCCNLGLFKTLSMSLYREEETKRVRLSIFGTKLIDDSSGAIWLAEIGQ